MRRDPLEDFGLLQKMAACENWKQYAGNICLWWGPESIKWQKQLGHPVPVKVSEEKRLASGSGFLPLQSHYSCS